MIRPHVAVEINKATGSDLYNGHCLETGTKDLLYTEVYTRQQVGKGDQQGNWF